MSPPSPEHPPPPQDARAQLLIGRHYSKWRLRHIRSVLLAYRGKEDRAATFSPRQISGKIFPKRGPSRFSTLFPPPPPPALRISPARPSPSSIVQRPEVIDIDLEGCANIWPSFPRTTLSRVRGFKPPSRGGAGEEEETEEGKGS